MIKAKINDIFVSIQGEGKFVGDFQCFVRFLDCNLSCKFCDTKISTYTEFTPDELISKIKEAIGKTDVKTISITGGEPLLYRDFLLEFLPRLKSGGFKIYLETNGVLCDELFDLIDNIDIVSMDIKLPSSTLDRPLWREHEEFLKVAKRKNVFIKVIICVETTLEDFKKAVDIAFRIYPEVTFILQPNTNQLGKELTDKLLEFKIYSRQYLINTKVIPQVHKLIGVK